MKTKILIFSLFFFTNFLFSQTVTTGAGINSYVQDVLVGGGVTVSNVTINTTNTDVIGKFSNCASTNIGLDNGVILACGDVNLALGPNNSGAESATSGTGGDADLQQLLGSNFSINDAVVLEFDFIPLSNHVDFQYVFASEEFPEFVNTSFNDVFGFFVSGPGINGPYSNNSANIALIPGTTNPVSIDNIFSTAFYVDNTGGQTIQYDGFTTVLTASFDVTPCVVYHIKIALGDAGDSAYDSAIFLKANSFTSNGISLNLSNVNDNGTGSTVIEGCGTATLSLTLDNSITNDTTIYYTIGGTATNGTDYNNLNGEATILAGDTSTLVTITPILDNITEGNETIELYVPSVCGVDTITVIIEDGYQVTSDFTVTSPICTGELSTITYTGNASDTATYDWNFAGGTIASGSGQGPYQVSWNSPGTYNVTLNVTSENGCTNSNSSMPVTVNPIPTPYFTPEVICEGDTSTITYIGNASTTASYYWIFPTDCPNTTVISGSGQGPYEISFGDGSASCSPAQIILTVSENGCTSLPDTNYVLIHPPGDTLNNCCEIPTPYAGLDDNICGNYYNLNANPVLLGNSGNWESISGPGNAIFTPVNSENAQVHVDVLGQYSFAWHEVSGSCENWDTVIVNFMPIVNAFAGPDTAFCDNVGQLSAQITQGNTGHWISQPGVTFTPTTNPNATVNVNTAGDYTLAWVETNGICSDTDYVDVTFYITPNAGADKTYTICAQSIDLSPTAGASTDVPSMWTSNSFGDIFSPSNTNTNVTWTIIPWGSANSHIDTAIYTLTNGVCSDFANHIVTFTQPPGGISVFPGNNDFTCDNVYTMQADAGESGGEWTYSDSRINMANYLDPNTEISYNPNNINWPNTCQFNSLFSWTIGNGNGCFANDTVRITFFQPTVANAGSDIGICGLLWRLSAIPSINCSEGMWSVASAPQGGGIIFGTGDQTNLATVPIQANVYGTYEFVWKEWNSYNQSCVSYDTVKVEFIRTPNVVAGNDTTICGKWIQLNATPDPAATYGSWHPATVNWVDTLYSSTLDAASQLRPDAFVYDAGLTEQECIDTIQFVWQQYVQGTDFPTVQCVAKDTMFVHFVSDIQAHNQTNVPDSICGRFIDLNSAQEIPTCGASGYWIDSLNNGQNWWQDENHTVSGNGPNTIYEIGNWGTEYLAFVIQNGGTADNPVCADTSVFTKVTFLQKPQVDACPDCDLIQNISLNNVNGINTNVHIGRARTDTVCLTDNNSFYLLNPDINLGNGSWSKSLNGIDFANGIQPTYNVTQEANDTVYVNIHNSQIGNTAGDYYVLVWKSENSSNGCSDSDTLLISFAKNPSGSIDFRRPFCYGQEALVWAELDNDANPTHFEWSFDQESTVINAVADATTPDSIYSVKWPQYNDCDRLTHEVRLVSSNDWGCISSAIKKNVVEPPLITPKYVNTDATCSQANGMIKVLRDTIVACDDTLDYTINHSWLASTIDSDDFAQQTDNGANSIVDSLYHISPLDTSWLELTYISIITSDIGWVGQQVQCKDTIEVMVDNSGLIEAIIDDDRMNDLNSNLSFDTKGNLTGFAPLDVTIYHNTPDAKQYKWVIRDEDGNIIWDSKAPYPNYTFAKGNYQIDLITTSKEGCIDTTLYKFIMVDSESFIKIPNVFTPNADGHNDFFQVYAKSIKAFKGVIMNRWGKVLYEWTDWTKPETGWDGKIAGDNAAPGVYYYIIRWKGIYDDKETQEKGALELVRSK